MEEQEEGLRLGMSRQLLGTGSSFQGPGSVGVSPLLLTDPRVHRLLPVGSLASWQGFSLATPHQETLSGPSPSDQETELHVCVTTSSLFLFFNRTDTIGNRGGGRGDAVRREGWRESSLPAAQAQQEHPAVTAMEMPAPGGQNRGQHRTGVCCENHKQAGFVSE